MRVLILIPTYNESENIVNLSQAIFSYVPEANILVIDDNSADGTGDLVDKLAKCNNRIKIIHRIKKLGLGTAYKTGFLYAVENKYDYVIEMDADFSHNPNDICRLIDKLKLYDLIIGSRYIKTNSINSNIVNWPRSRLLLSYFANLYARFLTATPIKEIGRASCRERV